MISKNFFRSTAHRPMDKKINLYIIIFCSLTHLLRFDNKTDIKKKKNKQQQQKPINNKNKNKKQKNAVKEERKGTRDFQTILS